MSGRSRGVSCDSHLSASGAGDGTSVSLASGAPVGG